MRIIITGGAGFIGSHLTEFLINKDYEVLVLDNLSTGSLANLKAVKNHPNFSFRQIDINKDKMSLYFKGIDWVFHLAALVDTTKSFIVPEQYFQTNITGTFNVLECCRKAKVKKIMYTASCSCYGEAREIPISEKASINPLSPYALTKYLGESMVLSWEKIYGLPSISLRLFNVYGPRSKVNKGYGSVFSVFLKQKALHQPFTIIGNGKQSRDFIYVTDVANAFYQAAISNISGDFFNIGSSKEHTINEIVKYLEGKTIHIKPKVTEVKHSCADISKTTRQLQWTPRISFKSGIRQMLQAFISFN